MAILGWCVVLQSGLCRACSCTSRPAGPKAGGSTAFFILFNSTRLNTLSAPLGWTVVLFLHNWNRSWGHPSLATWWDSPPSVPMGFSSQIFLKRGYSSSTLVSMCVFSTSAMMWHTAKPGQRVSSYGNSFEKASTTWRKLQVSSWPLGCKSCKTKKTSTTEEAAAELMAISNLILRDICSLIFA